MDETKILLELKLVSSLCLHGFVNLLCEETISFLSVFSSDPLFHCIVAFCTLVFLYLPHLFSKIVLSPVLILTVILLLSILRLGAIQRSQHERRENQGKHDENRGSKCRVEKQRTNPIEPHETTKSVEQVHQWVHSETEVISDMGFEPISCFVEWNVKAPLEVIYEEYCEGEEAGDDANQNVGIMRYPSLSRFFPESDSDSESESEFPAIGVWESPEDVELRWGKEEEDEEEDREGLIEIALDGCMRKRGFEFNFDEGNLIEIDISPSRYRELSGDDEMFSGEISCN